MNRLSSLTARIIAYLEQRGDLEHRRVAGLEPLTSLDALTHDHEDLASPDTFHAAREPLSSLDADKRRAQLLSTFIVQRVQEAAQLPVSVQLHTLESRATLETVDELLPFREALGRSAQEPIRPRRVALDRAVNRFLREHTDPYAQRIETAIRTSQRLGFETPVALQEALTGRSLTALRDEAQRCLRHTEDAYRDLLGYLLHKVDARLRPLPSGDAQLHDLKHACLFPATWVGLLRTEPFLKAITRWLGEAGFPPGANGHLRVDAEDRPTKAHGAHCVVRRAPDDVRVTVRPTGHAPYASAILRAFGRALSYALTSSSLPPELRWLRDEALSEGYGLLVGHLLCDAGWVERYLELSPPQARELARHFAFDAMRSLRRRCARLAYELDLHQRGPSSEREEEYGERLRKALFVDVPSGHYLREASVDLSDNPALTAEGFAGILHPRLVERFNEDYWRNPSAGRWLQSLFARGGETTTEALCTELGLPAPSLLPAGERLMAVMGA